MTAVMPETRAQALAMTAGRDELADALGYVGALAISAKHVLPILGGVKITAASGLATVEAFNYETHAVQVVQATGEGCALIPHARVVAASRDACACLVLGACRDRRPVAPELNHNR